MPKSRAKNEQTEIISLDLIEERAAFAELNIRDLTKMLVVREGEAPIPVKMPEGCLGVLLVFDSQEAVDKYTGKSTKTIQLVTEK
jgi:hypothetical protein